MTVKLPYRDLRALEDAQYNFEYLETHWSAAGPAGPTGPTGPAGPPGSGGDLTYVYNGTGAPASTWTVTHNLAKYPAVMVVDTGLNVLLADVHYINVNQLTVSFGAATSGWAYVN